MDGFTEVFETSFVSVPSDVLHGVSLTVVQVIGHGVLNRLDGVLLVMGATNLFTQRTGLHTF